MRIRLLKQEEGSKLELAEKPMNIGASPEGGDGLFLDVASYRRKGIVFSSSPREDGLDVGVSSIEGSVGGEDDIVTRSLPVSV
jgi:hypothetical protein